MQKLLQTLAFTALILVSAMASAQSGCNIRVVGEDSYGDGWNGGSLVIAQGDSTLQTFTLNSSAHEEVTVTLPTDDPVTFTWNTGSWDSEVTINIYDGGNMLVYTVSGPSSGVIYTMSSPCPSCLPSTNLTASSITSDGMTVSWSDAGNNGNYILSYWTMGSDITTVNLTDTTYTLSSLDANTFYYFSVLTVCSATDTSSALTGSFATACGGSTCDITLELGSTSTYSNPFTYSGGPASVELFQGGASIGTYSSTTTVEVCGTDTIVFKYNHSGYSWGDYYDNNASITIRDGGGVTVYSGSWGDTLCVVGNPCPTCIPPANLTIDSVTIDEIHLSWTPRSGASQFIVFLNDTLISDNVTDTTYIFTGLNANTQYSLSVQSVCSSDDSSSIVGISTRTSCGAMSLPFFVDFEDAAFNGAWYPCWDSTIHAGTDPSVNDQPGGSSNPTQHTPGGTYAMYLQGNSSENYNLVVGPEMTATGNEINVSFWAFVSNSSSWIKAGVITNPLDTSTFIPLVTVSGNNWTEYEFNTAALNATANYRIAWLGHGTGYIGKFDDISVSVYNGCGRPATVSVDTVTANTAELRWSSVTGISSYIVYYGTVNNVNDADVQSVTVSDTTATLTGLDAMTQYFAWVASDCGSGVSDVRPAGSFATSCEDVTCNLSAYVTDSYDDSWNGGYINIVQAGITVGTIDCPSSQSGSTFTFEVCSTAPVTLVLGNRGSYPSEMGGTISDGAGNIVFTISNMNSFNNGAVLASVATPCPECVPPTNLTVDSNITDNSATIYWTAQDGQSAWIVRIDSTDYITTDTFYVFYGLEARTSYTVGVATDCSGDTSTFTTTSFTTDCASGSCEVIIAAQDSYGDGWTGGTLNFYQNGALAGSYSMPGQGVYNTPIYDTATINVCSNIPVHFNWTAGSYESEVSYVIYDGGGAEIYNSDANGVNHSDSIANACPSCMTPTGLVANIIDSAELGFTWTVIDSVLDYLVSFNGGPWTSAVLPYIENNLSPNTAYTIRLKAICSLGDTSNERTLTVKTSCGQMVLPYSESFEADAQGSVPSCWTVTRPGYDGYPGISDSEHTGSNGLTLAANYNDSTTIATSLVPLAGDMIHVSFWASVNSGNTLVAGVMTDLAYDTTFIPLLTVPYNNSTYTLYEFNTTSLYSSEHYYVAFRLLTGGSNRYADLDDINISEEQGCSFPTNLVATPGTHNIDLTWHNGGTVSNFAIQYHATGDNYDTTLATTDTTFSITGLQAATAYTVRVGLICGNDTLWTTANATTLCDLLPVPYFENFYSATGELPPCWDYQSPVGWNNWPEVSGNGELMFGAYSAGQPAVLPQFNANFSKLQITFYTKCRADSEGDGILIGVADAAGNLVQWVDTLYHPNHSQAAWVEHTYNFLEYSGPGERIALGRKLNAAGNLWASIDSITVIALADCYPVDSLKAHNLIDPDHTYFTWESLGLESQWQVYVDTVTVNIDSVPDSLFTTVYDTTYTIPMGTIQGGGIYKFYVRADCEIDQSNWVSYEFGAGTVIMNNNTVADTVVGCGMVVYDNGGPVAGYLDYSNSALVIRAENAGSELQIFGGKFGWGESNITLTVYDGEGTTGSVLYQKTNTGTSNYTLDSILATSTLGAMTITFNCSGNYVHTGYELYIHCVGTALCQRPTQLNAEMTFIGEADVNWQGSASAYDLYYKPTGSDTWATLNSIANTIHLTGLLPDTTYDIYVIGICGTDTSYPSFPIVLNTHYEVVIEPCDSVSDLTVDSITTSTATVDWTSDGNEWQIELKHLNVTDTLTVSTKPYTLTGMLATMGYSLRVRTVCSDPFVDPYSEWTNVVNFTTASPNPGPGPEGIDNIDNSMLSLYPNPASTMVTMSVSEHMVGSTVNIVDVNGRVASKFEIQNPKFEIDLSTLAKGAYFVRIVGEQTTAVRKLIVK